MDAERMAAVLRGAQSLRQGGTSVAPTGSTPTGSTASTSSNSAIATVTPPAPAATRTPSTALASAGSSGTTLPNSRNAAAAPSLISDSSLSRASSPALAAPAPPTIKRPVGFRAVVVSTRQKGNPLLEHIRGVPYEFAKITPDYVTGAASCVLFLSIHYHRLHPEYIYNRIGKLGRDFDLRVLLIVCDVADPNDAIKELTKTALYHDLSIVVAWSFKEAATYISQLKAMETAPPTLIQGHVKADYHSQLIDVMAKVRGINKNDAISFVSRFGSFKDGVAAVARDPASLDAIGGWGSTKVKRFHEAITEPFIYNKTYKRGKYAALKDESQNNT